MRNGNNVLDDALLKGVKKETIDAYISTSPINQQTFLVINNFDKKLKKKEMSYPS